MEELVLVSTRTRRERNYPREREIGWLQGRNCKGKEQEKS
jgi:hypothetical protein